MYKNYENRVKEFVLDMTNPHSIIEYKDVTEKITNTREELMNEHFANNPEKKRPLIFRGYITEADRIKDTIKNHKYLYYLPDYEKIKKERKKLKASSPSPNISSKSKNLKNIKINNSSFDKNDISERSKTINKNFILTTPNHTINNEPVLNKLSSNKVNKNFISQPTMRYKPRTDLERIYDVLNGYHCDEKSKDIIERQLKSINLYDYKRAGDSTTSLGKENNGSAQKNNSKILKPKIIRSHQKKKKYNSIYKSSKLYYNPNRDNYKPWHKRDDLNNEAYGFLSSYHYKTHFKAAEEIAESNYKYDKNNKNKNSVFLLPNLIPNYYEPKNLKSDADSEEKEDPFKFGKDANLSDESEDYEEFDKNYNPIIKKTKTISDPEAMKILTKIAFKQKKNEFDNFDFKKDDEDEEKKLKKIKNKKGNKNYGEDDNVVIKNKLYFKNSQFDKITSEVLEMCNVYSTKSKFNNTTHKSKGGKTMITRGMTVGDFEKKYGLQEV